MLAAIGRRLGWIIAALVVFVVAVNLIWFVAPLLGSADVYRPLFSILVVVFVSLVWRQVRGEPHDG